jgi:parallel beta-helix repeat protein
MRTLTVAVGLVVVLSLAGCQRLTYDESAAEGGPRVTVIEPGEGLQERAQTALLTAQPGDVIEFAEGTFALTGTLSLDVDDVTVRGRGVEKTILDFAQQEAGTGGEGMQVTSDGFTIEALTVQNTKGDGIKVEGTDGVTFRNIFVNWVGPPRTENGAYGIYPVQCSNVLVEDSQVRGSSDAGIYIGQSKNIIVRRNKVWENVAGIEIENSFGADVHDNEATNNTGGILVFSLPEMPVKNGRDARVFRNKVHANNHPNFGLEGSIVSSLPPGTGIQVLANENVEVFENDIRDNDSYNVAILSYLVTGREYNDPEYDPYAEGIYVHHNTFSGGGQNPQGRALERAAALGGKYPDIVFDGFVNPDKLVDGKVAPELGIYLADNGDADFINLDLGAMGRGGEPKPTTDVLAHAGSLPNPPGAIVIQGAG